MARQQERAVRTRETLVRAAAEIFDEVGYSGASINKILDRAGATTGAMYFHFKSKEELARAVILEQAADLRLPEGGGGLQQLLDMTAYLAVEMQSNILFRAGVRLAVEQGATELQDYAIYEWWADQFRQELERARAMGQILPHVQEAEFARLLVGAYTGTQIMSQISTNRADLPERIASMWRCLLPALAPAEVIAELDLSRHSGITSTTATTTAVTAGAAAADETESPA
ncbi:ScbR family autoregulator-binding transcription factor [Streptomyces sp. NBC_00151]|uniref:ScbR family autoregulator-binding transcription factor n=1 Tax=Streptomyces sp. NBC_00151 TaxID=2975669 RepID=UPI002DD89752|nr:ScbR family autoregulator-binding transcription factor [Streptomyces sp. NBC_00151]WRZ37082.1 TetR/AcrR family transcriptional regulator [Streptomyces sp. NBC_00151]